MSFKVELLKSDKAKLYIEDLANFRIAEFKLFPYLYDGCIDKEITHKS